MTPGFQKALVDSSYDTMKSMSDMYKVIFRDMLLTADYYKQPPKIGRLSGRDKYFKIDLDSEVRVLNLDTKNMKSQSNKLQG